MEKLAPFNKFVRKGQQKEKEKENIFCILRT